MRVRGRRISLLITGVLPLLADDDIGSLLKYPSSLSTTTTTTTTTEQQQQQQEEEEVVPWISSSGSYLHDFWNSLTPKQLEHIRLQLHTKLRLYSQKESSSHSRTPPASRLLDTMFLPTDDFEFVSVLKDVIEDYNNDDQIHDIIHTDPATLSSSSQAESSPTTTTAIMPSFSSLSQIVDLLDNYTTVPTAADTGTNTPPTTRTIEEEEDNSIDTDDWYCPARYDNISFQLQRQQRPQRQRREQLSRIEEPVCRIENEESKPYWTANAPSYIFLSNLFGTENICVNEDSFSDDSASTTDLDHSPQLQLRTSETTEEGLQEQQPSTVSPTPEPIDDVLESSINATLSEGNVTLQFSTTTDSQISAKDVVSPPPPQKDEEKVEEKRLMVDYASKSAGALILEKSSSFKGASNLLNSDKDKYAIAPCEDEKFVALSLSEEILVKQVKLANFERYSSSPKEFQLLSSQTIDGGWVYLGTYTAKPSSSTNAVQVFDIKEPSWARYLQFRFLTHYGEEHYCTVSQIMVHGNTMLQGFHEQWKESEEETQKILNQVGGTSDEEADNDNTGSPGPLKTVDASEENHAAAAATLDSRVETTNSENRKATSDLVEKKKEEDDEEKETATPTLEDKSMDNRGDGAGSSPIKGNHEASSDTTTNNNKQQPSKQTGEKKESDDDIPVPGTESVGATARNNSITKSSNELDGNYKLQRLYTPDMDSDFESVLSSASICLSSNKLKKNANHRLLQQQRLHGLDKKAVTLSHRKPLVNEKQKRSIRTTSPPTPSDTIATEPTPTHAVVDVVEGSSIFPNLAARLNTFLKSLDDATEHLDAAVNALPVVQKIQLLLDNTATATATTTTTREGDETPTHAKNNNEEDATTAEKKEASPAVDSSSLDPESNPILGKFLEQKLPNIECMKGLDYTEFKAKIIAATHSKNKSSSNGSSSGNSHSGGQGPGHPSSMEPIFKKLTDEIKSLQINLSVHDQFTKAAVTCYQQVLFDLIIELETVKLSHEDRILKLENELRKDNSFLNTRILPTTKWVLTTLQYLLMGFFSFADRLLSLVYTSALSLLGLLWSGFTFLLSFILVVPSQPNEDTVVDSSSLWSLLFVAGRRLWWKILNWNTATTMTSSIILSVTAIRILWNVLSRKAQNNTVSATTAEDDSRLSAECHNETKQEMEGLQQHSSSSSAVVVVDSDHANKSLFPPPNQGENKDSDGIFNPTDNESSVLVPTATIHHAFESEDDSNNFIAEVSAFVVNDKDNDDLLHSNTVKNPLVGDVIDLSEMKKHDNEIVRRDDKEIAHNNNEKNVPFVVVERGQDDNDDNCSTSSSFISAATNDYELDQLKQASTPAKDDPPAPTLFEVVSRNEKKFSGSCASSTSSSEKRCDPPGLIFVYYKDAPATSGSKQQRIVDDCSRNTYECKKTETQTVKNDNQAEAAEKVQIMDCIDDQLAAAATPACAASQQQPQTIIDSTLEWKEQKTETMSHTPIINNIEDSNIEAEKELITHPLDDDTTNCFQNQNETILKEESTAPRPAEIFLGDKQETESEFMNDQSNVDWSCSAHSTVVAAGGGVNPIVSTTAQIKCG